MGEDDDKEEDRAYAVKKAHLSFVCILLCRMRSLLRANAFAHSWTWQT